MSLLSRYKTPLRGFWVLLRWGKEREMWWLRRTIWMLWIGTGELGLLLEKKKIDWKWMWIWMWMCEDELEVYTNIQSIHFSHICKILVSFRCDFLNFRKISEILKNREKKESGLRIKRMWRVTAEQSRGPGQVKQGNLKIVCVFISSLSTTERAQRDSYLLSSGKKVGGE